MLNSYLLVFLTVALTTLSQGVPFSTTGWLDSAVSSGTSVRSGGTVSVNGFTITIPDNLLVEFPAAQVPFKEFVDGNKGPGPDEVSINGNIVNGKVIAGQMTIAQLSLQSSTGYIESLSFDGAIKIVNGPVIRINDPNAKYSSGYTTIPFFTADDENPSVSSFGGFPMCVPRSANDDKCPSSNRPGKPTVADPLNYQVPNPLLMAPMKVGDFVTYSGIKDNDEIICFNIDVNIGIFTAPGTAPGFIKVEDAIVGVPSNNPNVEVAGSRFGGSVTDPSTGVQIYAIDQDPCTGDETDRLLGSVSPEPAVGGRAKWEFKTGNSIGALTRNYRIKLTSGTKMTTNGILGGQYVQPVTEWIFPEVIIPGATQPELGFDNIAPLANGFGPDDAGNVFHQLSPWPGSVTPVPKQNCPDTISPPTTPLKVDAGADRTVRGGSKVTLTANQSNPDHLAKNLQYKWTQTAGSTTGVQYAGADTATYTVTVPVNDNTATIPRTFQVVVTDVTVPGSSATDTVIVTADKTSLDHPVVDIFTWVSKQSGTVTVTAHTDLVADPNASMSLKFGSTAAFQKMTSVGTGQGQWTFTASKTAQPASVTIQTFIGTTPLGQATKTGLTAKKRSLGMSARFANVWDREVGSESFSV